MWFSIIFASPKILNLHYDNNDLISYDIHYKNIYLRNIVLSA